MSSLRGCNSRSRGLQHRKDLVEIGVVACERFLIDVDQLIARCHHKGRSELSRPAACLVLTVAAGEGPGTGEERVRPDQRCGSESVRLDDVRCLAFLIEEDRKRDGLVLDECLCVSSASRADGRHIRTGFPQLFVSVSDLTGPLTTGQSTEMSEEKENVWIFGPQVPKSMRRTVRIG